MVRALLLEGEVESAGGAIFLDLQGSVDHRGQSSVHELIPFTGVQILLEEALQATEYRQIEGVVLRVQSDTTEHKT